MTFSNLRAILFDLDGVIYQGDAAIAGAGAALEQMRAQGIPCRFVTNTTSRPRSAICSKLAAMGIRADAQDILSPPVAAARTLASNAPGAVALFVPEATQIEFSGLPLWDGDETAAVGAVVVGDLGAQWSFERLNLAFRLLMRQPAPAFLALGMTRYWKAGDGLRLDTGPFVEALRYATGIEPQVMGKPAPAFFAAACEALGVDAAQVLMIGDDIRGDIQGAQKAGLKALLVRTGKFRPADLQGDVRPDAVIDSIAGLPDWWRQNTGG